MHREQACRSRRVLSTGLIVKKLELSMQQNLTASLYSFSHGSFKGAQKLRESGIYCQLPADIFDKFFVAMVFYIQFLKEDIHILVR